MTKNQRLKIKYKKNSFFFLACFLVFVFYFLFLNKAQAQSSISLTAIPPRLELTAKPGETLQETIKVRNDSNTELVVQSKVKDFIVVDNQGTPKEVNEKVSGRWSLASWMTVSPLKTPIKAKTTQVQSLVITVPSDALPGGHYAIITHSPLSEGLIGQGSGAKVSQKVGTLVYLKVEGDISEDANIIRFEADKNLAEYGPVKLTTEIKNLSDVHIQPKAKITIYNTLNQIAAKIPLDKVNIFPFQSRLYQVEFPNKWHFGRYKAVLEATYGTRGKALTGLIYFWIIPWKLIAAIAFALSGLLIIVWLFHRHQNKKRKTTSLLEKSN